MAWHTALFVPTVGEVQYKCLYSISSRVLSGCGESTEKKQKKPLQVNIILACARLFFSLTICFYFTQFSLSEQSVSSPLLISAFHSLSLDSPSFLPPFLPPSPCPPAAKLQLCLGKADCGIPGKPLKSGEKGRRSWSSSAHLLRSRHFVVKGKRLMLLKSIFSLSQYSLPAPSTFFIQRGMQLLIYAVLLKMQVAEKSLRNMFIIIEGERKKSSCFE